MLTIYVGCPFHTLTILFLSLFFPFFFLFFFFNDTATTEIYTLSLHDALPIFRRPAPAQWGSRGGLGRAEQDGPTADRKSTRLNSSHRCISYAVFCLKKKKKKKTTNHKSYKYKIQNKNNF